MKIFGDRLRFIVRIIALVALICLPLSAQQGPAPPSSTWARVKNIPAETNIQVNALHQKTRCMMKFAGDDSLTCVQSGVGQTIVIPRADILTIKRGRRGRSTGIGLAVGFGVGAIVGAAGCHDGLQGVCAVGLGLEAGIVGTLVGLLTDFSRSTIYRAP